MPGFEIRPVPRHNTAVVAVSTTPAGIGEAMAEAMPKPYAAVIGSGGTPVGPPFSRYFTFGETIDFEAGVPVAAPFVGDGEVKASEIGGGEAAVGMHVGPYDTIGQTYEALTTWVSEQGRTPAGAMWEIYLTDPSEEPDPSKWLTEVYVPLVP